LGKLQAGDSDPPQQDPGQRQTRREDNASTNRHLQDCLDRMMPESTEQGPPVLVDLPGVPQRERPHQGHISNRGSERASCSSKIEVNRVCHALPRFEKFKAYFAWHFFQLTTVGVYRLEKPTPVSIARAKHKEGSRWIYAEKLDCKRENQRTIERTAETWSILFFWAFF
jgi:hypothetical protein